MNRYPHSDIINYSDFDIFEGRHIMEKFKDFGDVLAKARKQKHLKQSELATLLNEHGVSVTNQAISKWETGKVVPNAIQFLALCDIYGIDDALYFFPAEEVPVTVASTAEDEFTSKLPAAYMP